MDIYRQKHQDLCGVHLIPFIQRVLHLAPFRGCSKKKKRKKEQVDLHVCNLSRSNSTCSDRSVVKVGESTYSNALIQVYVLPSSYREENATPPAR